MRWFLLLLLALPLPAVADDMCHDLWFTRDQIMDRAGYCFGSALGRTVFDNRDCIDKEVSLGRSAQAKVAEIQRRERDFQCKVNAGGTRLDVSDIEIRRHLDTLLVRDEFESGCIGWQEDVMPLRAAPSAGANVVGRIEPGDDVMYSRGIEDGWSYVTVHRADWSGLNSGGWLFEKQYNCRMWAG